MTKTLLVATHNQGKVKEYAEMLSDLDINWQSLDDIGLTQEVEESGATFLENALLKAAGYAREAGCLTLADDSGLVVDALDGAPGVTTARYGGPELSSRERYEYLLSNLRGVPSEERTARFVCIIALSDAGGNILATAEGRIEGTIAEGPAGDGGFGYDPVFYVPQTGSTMAELPPQTKHTLSHRGNALRAIEPQLRAVLAND
ncbi:MAG: RdgB/HAM1 family non-canonical purine NTP pyrophosphatase [Candidatus Promineifilaceae bacterium]